MGNCASSQDDATAKARSAEIDKQLEEDLRKFKKECKILLLGASFLSSLHHAMLTESVRLNRLGRVGEDHYC